MKILIKPTVFLFFVLLSCASLLSQQYWIRQVSPTNKWLTKCTFTDSLYGWAVGDSGIVIHTSNGGVNWNIQNSTADTNPINDFFFLNRRLGWLIYNDNFGSAGSFIVKTTNSGEVWNSSRFFDTTNFLTSVCFVDSLSGFVGTFYGQVFKTLNGGLNWINCNIDSVQCSSFVMNKIRFLNAQTGFICGGHNEIVGEVWKTTNQGSNWRPYCIAGAPLLDLMYDNGKITTVGGEYDFVVVYAQTTDNGNIWKYSIDSSYGIGETIALRTPAELWVPVGFAGRWSVNNDSGKAGSWYSIPVPDSSAIYAAQFTSSTNGWAFGTGGSIYKYNSGIIGITNNQNIIPLSANLFQNYPNPFNPSTIIKFSLSKAGLVKLRIYDILGKEVKVLINGFIDRGEHAVNFDAGELPSGVYFYQIEASQAGSLTVDFKESKKMVLMK